MCGFFGFTITDSYEQSLKKGNECLKSISHRGPDYQHLYKLDSLMIGHARLSIVDLSNSSNQPFEYEHITILFNGEIYNYQLLKTKLITYGFKFRTNSDTEVIAASYLKWGVNCVSHFDGMFAFSIYDKKKKKLILARDIFGQKPIYFYIQDNKVCFSSELTTFKYLLNELKINLEAMVHFLRIGYILNPLTPFQDINLLKPAHILEINLDNYTSTLTKYFSYDNYFRAKNKLKINEIVEKAGYLLTKAIEKRMMGEVPFGIFLSSGLDSSGILGILNKKLSVKTPTYTIGFNDRNYDESYKAQNLCNYFNIPNETIYIDKVKLHDIDDFLEKVDYINFDSSAFPLYLLSKQASKNVKFILNGDGGDEIFGGYSTYKANSVNEKIKHLIPFLKILPIKNILSFFFKNDNVGISTKINRFIAGISRDTKKAHFNWRLVNSVDEITKILGENNREFIRETDPFNSFLNFYDEVRDLENYDQHLYVDTQTWLTDNNLIKTDRVSMLNGLEVRSPYLDKELVCFLASCPTEFKKEKVILKEVLKGILPEDVLKRKKIGFNAPISNWYNTSNDEYKFYTKLIFNKKFKLLMNSVL